MTNCKTYQPRFERAPNGDIWQMDTYGCLNWSELNRRGERQGLLTPERLEQLANETELRDKQEQARLEGIRKGNEIRASISRGEITTA